MARKQRNRVLRLDGKPIHLVAKRAHLMVCAKGCCCGHTERGHAAVPVDFYKQEYKKRKIRKLVQLTMSGCLGPCPLANVALLFFDGRPIWFQSINGEAQIRALFDYIDQMLAADSYLPPPPELSDYVFTYYAWAHAPPSCRPAPALPACAANGAGADGILFLTHADTDLLALRSALPRLPDGSPPVRALSLGKIATAEHLAAALAWPGASPRIIVARLLGSIASVPGLRGLADAARARGQHLIVVSGTAAPDPELTAACTVSPAVVHEATAYLQAGGPDNFAQMLRFLADHLLLTGLGHAPPAEQPQHGVYHPDLPHGAMLQDWLARREPARPTVGLLFYRSHWMSGNLAFIDACVRELEAHGANALPVFTASLKEESPPPEGILVGRWPAAFSLFVADGRPLIDVLVTTVSFALGEVQPDGPTPAGWSVSAFAALGVPVLHAVCGGTARWQWEASQRGLSPLDTAMNVALPEFDGRIITVPISFKEPLNGTAQPAEAIHYAPVADRVNRVAGLALRFAALRRKPNHDKRVAFILTNSPGKAAKIGNAVGLDARPERDARRWLLRGGASPRWRRPDPRAHRPLLLRRYAPDRRATGQRRRPRWGE
jgi:cobaltochelatase CobN